MTGFPSPTERPLLTADEARHALGDVTSRSAWYDALKRGDVPGVRRVGGRVFLATAELAAWCALEMPENGASNGNGDGAGA